MSARHVQLEPLTGLRGIAAWAVVLYHIRPSLTSILPPAAIQWLSQGFMAVDLFFLLSGFVIWYNYADRIIAGPSGMWRLFLWRRFARIWPLHAVILAALVGFVFVLMVTGRSTAGYPWAELPLHVLLLQNWGMTSALSWNHPAWSISAECAAYLLFPMLARLLAGCRRQPWLVAAVAAALFLSIALLFLVRGHVSLGDDIPGLGLWRCLAEFTLGCLLCIAWQALPQRTPASPVRAVALAIAAALLLLSGLGAAWPPVTYVPMLLFCILGAIVATPPSFSQVIGRPLAKGPLHYLGEISYSTYLSHYSLFILYKLVLFDATLQLSVIGLVGYLLLVLVMSITLYHGVELRAQRWLNAHPPRGLIADIGVARRVVAP